MIAARVHSNFRALVLQALIFALLAAAVLYLFQNLGHNLESRGATTGFSFLNRVARIPIANSPLEFEQGVSTYGFALLVGAINTLKISAAAILLSSVVGLIVGVGRLSSNLLVARLSAIYVEAFRNVPVLLHVLIWYTVLASLPGPREAFAPLPGVFISNRAVNLPSLVWSPSHGHVLAAIVIAVVGAFFVVRWATRARERTGHVPPAVKPMLALCAAVPVVIWFAIGVPPVIEVPELEGFGFVGGAEITPEYGALLVGLTLYTAAFIAEIVRAGILSVHKGQWEASDALGLGRRVTLFKVVLPQALRVGIPPVTSEYLGIVKNSSLAVAIGYQEITSVGSTTLYETGQAVEVIAITMAFYLAVSLAVSAFMNWYNARVALVER